MKRVYPWYELVDDGSLEQGDLLQQCPVVSPRPHIEYPLRSDIVPIDVVSYDLIVLTQSCDLVNEKISDVILCAHWGIEDSALMNPDTGRKEFLRDARQGRRYRYTLLNECDISGMESGIRVVDFGRVYSLPKPFVQSFVGQQNPRLRLLPPYREHLSQAFARFFMRVGLPQDIEVPR